MNLTENRVDASLLSEEERAMLQPLLDMAAHDKHPCFKTEGGGEVRIPKPIFQILVKAIQEIRLGKAVVLMPEDETFTTQAAADFLGMSRQFFVTLLEAGQIPYYRVGSHRRVQFRDLREYAAKRDTERREGLNRLFTVGNDGGLDRAVGRVRARD